MDAEYGALMDAGKCKIKVIVASDATSIGDCLRSVEELNVIEDGSTFVLVHGDIVSNVPLTPIIDAHKERYKKNKSNIMTMMFKAVDPGHKMRSTYNNITPVTATVLPEPLARRFCSTPCLPCARKGRHSTTSRSQQSVWQSMFVDG